MSLHIKESIKAKAMKEQEIEKKSIKICINLQSQCISKAKKESLLIIKCIIPKETQFRDVRTHKRKSETVLVDTRVCEFFKALHIFKDEKMTVARIHHHLG